ncbi:MAG: hypothetical protein WAQ27_00205 [Candidatus Microsaccharimonas sp.]
MSRENYILHKHIEKKKRLTNFDIVIIIASFLYPLTGIPQVIQIFQGATDGVSIYSWVGFMCFSTLFLIYGFKHKIVPMMITNSIWILIDSLVVIGFLLYN